MKLNWLDKVWIELALITALLWSFVHGQDGDNSNYYTGGGGNYDGDYGGQGYYQVYNNYDPQDNNNDNYQYQGEVEVPSVLCYVCHYHVMGNVPEGMPGCDEPFDETGIPTVNCYNDSPCGQYTGNNKDQVQDSGPTTILCYTCHYHIQSDYAEGMPNCDDPFEEEKIPTVNCPGPCGKIRQVMTGGKPDDYMVTRNCIPKCKERPNDEFGNYQECCSTPLCNGASGSRTTASSMTFIVTSIASIFLLLR